MAVTDEGPSPAQSAPPARSERPAAERALLLGLDGATFDIITPLIADGELPVLAKLIKTGASGSLVSPLPITPAAWTSSLRWLSTSRAEAYAMRQ